MKRFIFMILGFLSFALGLIGVFLPLLPTVPFFLATGFFWIHSSEKLHQYLLRNKYYKKYITEMIVQRRMSKAGLFGVLMSTFILLAIFFFMVNNTWMRVCLVIIFLAHAILLPWHFSKKTDFLSGVS